MATKMTTPTVPVMEALTLDPKKILVHPRNPRRDVTADDELVASVKAQGVLQPLLLAPVPADLDVKARGGREFVLIAGHRRLDAAVRAKLREVPVTVRRDLDTQVAQIEAMVTENTARKDLSPLEEGDAYLALQGLGLSQTQINVDTGVAKGRVSERSRVARLPENVREKLAGGQLTLEAGLSLARLVDDPDELARITRQPVYLWDSEVDRAVRAREHAKTRAKEDAAHRKELVDAGVSVLDDFPAAGDDGSQSWALLSDIEEAAVDAVTAAVLEHRGEDVTDGDEEDLADFDFAAVEEWHRATCAGHAVVRQDVKGNSWSPEFTRWETICMTPAAHEELLLAGAAADGEDTAGDGSSRLGRPGLASRHEEVPSEEDTALAAALTAAAATRRVWLADLLADANQASGAVWKIFNEATAVPGALARVVGIGGHDRTGVAVMGEVLARVHPPETDGSVTPGAVVHAWAQEAVEAQTTARLVLAAVLSSHGSAEFCLATTPAEWRSVAAGYGYCKFWVQVLDWAGYPWTAPELQWLGRDTDADTADDTASAGDDDAGEALSAVDGEVA